MKTLPRNTILTGGAQIVMSDLLPESVDAVITSPPYFQLRDYQVTGQLGLESTVAEWVANLRAVCRAIARVLKPHGSLWLNLGDSYSRSQRSGAPPKSLVLAPERLLLALADDGWLVRNKVVYAKRNPMPESVTDRLAVTWEPIYLLTRSRDYFFDLDAIREPHGGSTPARPEANRRYQGGNGGLTALKQAGRLGHPLGKNPGDVWPLPKATFRGAHFATFPEALVERPIMATVPERICVQCDRPWRRRVRARKVVRHRGGCPSPGGGRIRRYRSTYDVIRTRGELVRCGCFAPTRPGIVLDPFFGTGTVGVVATRLGRDWLGIELNPDYVQMARARLDGCPVGGRSLGSFCPPHQPSTTSKEVGP